MLFGELKIFYASQFLGVIDVVHVDAAVNYTDLESLSNSEFISFAVCDLPYHSDFSLYSLVHCEIPEF